MSSGRPRHPLFSPGVFAAGGRSPSGGPGPAGGPGDAGPSPDGRSSGRARSDRDAGITCRRVPGNAPRGLRAPPTRGVLPPQPSRSVRSPAGPPGRAPGGGPGDGHRTAAVRGDLGARHARRPARGARAPVPRPRSNCPWSPSVPPCCGAVDDRRSSSSCWSSTSSLTRQPARGLACKEAAWLVGVLRRDAAGLRRFVWARFGTEPGTEYLTGYLVEKSLLGRQPLRLHAPARARSRCPARCSSGCCSTGIIGALLLRGVFIALGAAALDAFSRDVPRLRRDPHRHRGQGAARRPRPATTRRGRRRADPLGAADPALLPGHRRLPRHRG